MHVYKELRFEGNKPELDSLAKNIYTVFPMNWMIHRVTCDRCGSISEYDDKSIWEGNREHEDVECPVCGNIIGSAFTDLTPVARLIKKGEKN